MASRKVFVCFYFFNHKKVTRCYFFPTVLQVCVCFSCWCDRMAPRLLSKPWSKQEEVLLIFWTPLTDLTDWLTDHSSSRSDAIPGKERNSKWMEEFIQVMWGLDKTRNNNIFHNLNNIACFLCVKWSYPFVLPSDIWWFSTASIKFLNISSNSGFFHLFGWNVL